MSRQLLTALAAVGLVACKSDRDLFAQEQTDTFRQAPNNQVDILWVIDDSNSMEEEQETLRAGFDSFASRLEESGADFHIGVISTSFDYTDPSRGVLKGEPPYLTNTDDYLALFSERAVVGTDGSDKEKGLEAALYALQPVLNVEGAPNAGFVRPDAQLLVVFVSDEEDCSDRGALEGQPGSACYENFEDLPSVNGFVTDYRQLKDDQDLVSVGAIIGTPQSTCAQQVEGTRYSQLVRLLGGIVGDICQGDWSNILSAFGVNASGIRSRFQLSEAAKPETIEVTVDDDKVVESPVAGWTYDEQTWFLEFHGDAIPPRGSVIGVTYTIQPGVPYPPADDETAGTTATPAAR
jgi:hypothetical protein